jgi:uncharacterized protein (DUF4415 family)
MARSKFDLEERLVSTARGDDGKFHTVVRTWRGQNGRLISFRRARDGEEREYRQIHGVRDGCDDRAWRKSNELGARALTHEEIEADVAVDSEEAGMVVDGSTVTANIPIPKAVLNMRVDHDVLDYFRREGRGYQSRINAVLRTYVDQTRSRKRG